MGVEIGKDADVEDVNVIWFPVDTIISRDDNFPDTPNILIFCLMFSLIKLESPFTIT